jgi:hypothetical protein
MKAYRKSKMFKEEFEQVFAIGKNYHKFLWKKFKRRIKLKRLHKK